MNTLRSVLREVKSGTTNFAPASDNKQDMWDFQPIAKILIYAHQNNYVENCISHKESETSHGWYDLVIVRGGLTYEGEMFLATPEEGKPEAKLEEIVQLNPNIYGIGVNLKAVWQRWKYRKG